MTQQHTLLEWHRPIWQQLKEMHSRLPHALLLHGQAGTGKLGFAKTLSQALLCKSPTVEGDACQACSSCHWFDDESHPDFRIVQPEEGSEGAEKTTKKKSKKKQNISIAQVRALSDFVNLTSHNDKGLRIILIHPVETLNIAAANALLKMLEEPASNVIFILISHQLQRILPTILSRCHKVAMPRPTKETATVWLQSQGIENAAAQLAYFADSPMKVLEQSEQFEHFEICWKLLAQGSQMMPAITANKLIGQSVEAGITILQKWLYDIVSLKRAGQVRYHHSQIKSLQSLSQTVNLLALFDLQKKVESLRKLATHPLNHELQLESLLLEYTKLFSHKY